MTNTKPIQLDSLEKIAKACKVTPKRVKKWCSMTPKPPIAIEGEGNNRRYSAEYYTLQNWRFEVFAPKS